MMPGGRPTDYDESFCDKVVELGAMGKSVEQIAKELGFAIRTLYLWRDTYPQFMQGEILIHSLCKP